jgi:hypothetical protein
MNADGDKYTLLLNHDSDGSDITDAIYAVRALGRAIESAAEGVMAEDSPEQHLRVKSQVMGLASAVTIVGAQLAQALGSVNQADERIVRDALARAAGGGA